MILNNIWTFLINILSLLIKIWTLLINVSWLPYEMFFNSCNYITNNEPICLVFNFKFVFNYLFIIVLFLGYILAKKLKK
jgi:hypothetical protein